MKTSPKTPTPLLILCLLLAGALTACGGDNGGESPDKTKTPTATKTPTKTPEAKPPKDIDPEEVGQSFDTIISVCAKRVKSRESRSDSELTTQLREAVTTHIEAFGDNPDEKYRRAAGRPSLSMRERLRQLSLLLRQQCGDGVASSLGKRMSRVARRKSSS